MTWTIRTQTLLGLSTVALLFVGVGIFGLFGSLAGAVVSSGQVELEARSQIVQHPDGGVVKAILVRDGDRVHEGDILLSLEGTQLVADRIIVTGQLLELEARAVRLLAESTDQADVRFPDELAATAKSDTKVAQVLAGQRAVFDAALRTFRATTDATREQQDQIRQEIEGLDAQSKALAEQIALLDAEYENAAALLQKGLTEAPRVSELKRAMVGLIGQKAQSEAAIAARQADIARLDVEVARLASARQEKAVVELRDVETKLAELIEQQSLLDKKIARLDLRAPRDGIVQGLQIHTLGAVIRAADPVLSVIPQDGRFLITAKVDAHQVDSVFVGQAAALRFSAFDARTTPELMARITRVSADIFTDNRTGAQFYTAEAVPDAGEFAKLDGKVLLPGMPVEVHIQTGSHAPLAYVLKPFTDYFATALKE